MNIIVYGTLKSGYSNNRLLSSSKKVDDCIVRGYKLYNSGFPVACPDPEASIVGEIWDVDDRNTLDSLDRLEGCHGNGISNRGMYYRQTILAHTESGSIQGEMYVGHPDFWNNFTGMRECPIDEQFGAYRWEGYSSR